MFVDWRFKDEKPILPIFAVKIIVEAHNEPFPAFHFQDMNHGFATICEPISFFS